MPLPPPRLVPTHSTSRPLFGILFWLALALPAAAAPTSLKFSVTVPASFNESNRQAVLEWNAEPAKTYLVQSATNLSTTTIWKTEEPVRATSAGPIQWMAPDSLGILKYYRLVLPRPEIYSVEPAFVNSEDPGALFYVSGQCLPTNGFVVINGQNFAITSFDPNGSWVALSLNGLPPGTPILGAIQMLDNNSNVVATLPPQYPVFYGTELTAEQLQGPPEDPPASRDGHAVEEIEFVVEKVERARTAQLPGLDDDDDGDGDGDLLKKEFKGHVTLLKRGDAGGSGAARHTKTGHVTLLKRGDSGSSSARHTKSGHVTLLKRGDSSSNARTGGSAADSVVVCLGSGELQSEETDLSVVGRGIDFAWTRTYRSRAEMTTLQGANWDFSYNVSASLQPDGTVILRPGNGRADTFYPDGTNGWTRDEYLFYLHDLDQDGSPDEVIFPDGGKWVLNPPGTAVAGKLAQIVDRNNNTIRCEYDAGTGRLVRVVDTLDRTNTVAYTSKGFIESVTDFSGRTVRYEYSSSADLVTCVSPEVLGTPNGNDFPGGKTNRYAYSTGNLDPRLNHNLVSVTDPKGQTSLQITYQPTNNPASLDFDAVSSVLRGVDRKDIWRGSVAATASNSFATVQAVVNDYVGDVTEYLFDSRQRCVSLREFTGRANPGFPTTPTLNRPVGKLRAEDPDYFETRWEWNPDSLCTREIRFDGGSTEISHQRAQDHNSSRSNKTASRRHDGDVRIVHERPSKPVDTDGSGKQNEENMTWIFEYHVGFGSPPKAKGKKLFVGNLPYSASDRKGWDGTIKGSSGVESAKVITDRDSGRSKGFGFVVSSLDPRGNETTAEYDSHGNRTRLKLKGHYAVSNLHVVVDGVYNAYGQLTVVTNAADENGYRRVDTIGYYTNGPQMGMVEVMIASALSGGLALTTSFQHDSRGNVTNIVDPRGNDLIFTYNALDQCVSRQTQQSSFGERVKSAFYYDANDNLVRCDVENRDEADTLVATNPQWTTQFEYDGFDRVTGVVEEISEGGGLPGRYATNRFVYDGNDNLVEVRSPMAVSGADPYATVAYQYDERDLLYREIAAPGSPAQSTTQCDYDSNGNLTRLSEGLESTPAITTLAYDGFAGAGECGNPARRIRVHEGLAPRVSASATAAELARVVNKQCVEKDIIIRLESITDPMGNVTTFNFDRNSNLKVVRHFGETNDVPGGAGNRLLSETRLTYDWFDRCVQQADSFFTVSTGSPVGDGLSTTTFTYALNDACTSVTDDNGHTTRFGYDTAGRLTSVTDPKTNAIQLVLDACGNVIGEISNERSEVNQASQQFSVTHTYDTLNRCIASTDNVGNTNRYAYDSRGNLVSHLDPRENETFAMFDGLNRCVTTINYVGKERGITINTSHVEYDTNSRRTAATDSNGNTTQYDYDSLDRCVAVTDADGTSCSLVWSPRSNLLRQQNANGTVITNSYDLLDRCVSRLISPGPGVVPSTTFETFAYDGFSRCVAASNDVSLTTFAYNSLGDCVRSTQDGLTSSSTYDGEGNCLSRTYPGGRIITYTYDALDQVASVSSSAGGLPPTMLAQFAYDGSGRIGSVSRANGVSTRVLWSGLVNPPNATGDFGWLSNRRVTHARVAGNVVLDQRTFLHDPSQNTISRVRTAVAPIPAETNALSYDALDRLTNVVRVSGSTNDVDRQYVLDGNGNRQVVVENGAVQTYTMDNTSPVPADFQMNQYTSTPFDSQQHDDNGNLVVRSTALGPIFYLYDYADRLVQVRALNGGGIITIASYVYDALGARTRRILNPGPGQTVTDYTHCGESDVLEERVDGILTRTYVRSEVDGDILVAYNQAGDPQYYHYDDAGNTLALTDAGGGVIERYDYDDYGTVTFLTSDGIPTGAPSSAVGNVYCWGGLCLDSETGLHNDLGGGYFDPHMGRWITSMGLPKVTPKLAKEHHGRFASGNNPWSGDSPQAMEKGKVKFFNDAKGFGRLSSGGSSQPDDGSGGGGGGGCGGLHKEFKGHVTLLKRGDSGSSSAARHTKTGHVTLLKRGDSGSTAMIVAGSMSSEKKHTKSGHVTLMK